MGVIDLGYPLWLLISVLVVFAGLLYYILRGRVRWAARASGHSSRARVHRAAVAVAVVLSALLSPFYEAPTDPVEPQPRTSPATAPSTTPLETTGPTASPTSSPTRPRPRPPRHPRRRPRPLLRRRLLESISARSGLRLSLVSQSAGMRKPEMLTGRVDPSSIRNPGWSWFEGGSFVRVLVAGAHGKTARRLVRMLAEDGHEVRGLVRKEEQTGDVEADGAEPVVVDLEAEEVGGGSGGRSRGATPSSSPPAPDRGAGPSARRRWTTAGPPSWSRPRRNVGAPLPDAQLYGRWRPRGGLGGDASLSSRQVPRRRTSEEQ